MDRYEQLIVVYERFETQRLRADQDFDDVFPAMDSTIALSYWEDATTALESQKRAIDEAIPDDGETLAEVAACADRREAFTALISSRSIADRLTCSSRTSTRRSARRGTPTTRSCAGHFTS